VKQFFFIFLIVFQITTVNVHSNAVEGLPLYYWQKGGKENFGDYLSLKLVERIVGGQVKVAKNKQFEQSKRLLAIGSILILSNPGDVIWGTGMNGKRMDVKLYPYGNLDVRAVRGPLTRNFLINSLNIACPEVYGDPALLFPYFFPEFKKKEKPQYSHVIIPHYSEEHLFPKELYPNVVYPTEPWRDVIRKILNSEFVISSSLHGIIIAEAYGIPARYLRISDHEPLYKYEDYYKGTNRSVFEYATSVEDALNMGGEPPCMCDLEKLYYSFPFECWPNATFIHPNF
jgi:pyruvyltransferase